MDAGAERRGDLIEGTDFVQLEVGKLQTVTGFLDKVPTALELLEAGAVAFRVRAGLPRRWGEPGGQLPSRRDQRRPNLTRNDHKRGLPAVLDLEMARGGAPTRLVVSGCAGEAAPIGAEFDEREPGGVDQRVKVRRRSLGSFAGFCLSADKPARGERSEAARA